MFPKKLIRKRHEMTRKKPSEINLLIISMPCIHWLIGMLLVSRFRLVEEMPFKCYITWARWKLLGQAFNRRETRDKRLLGRDLDRSWCHLHNSILVTDRGSMDIGSSILIVWRWYHLLSGSLPNGCLSRVGCRLGRELFTLPVCYS